MFGAPSLSRTSRTCSAEHGSIRDAVKDVTAALKGPEIGVPNSGSSEHVFI